MARGELRVYLGAAAGVGKTYAMLNEGHRRREYGEDVVVGFVEPHKRAKTAIQAPYTPSRFCRTVRKLSLAATIEPYIFGIRCRGRC